MTARLLTALPRFLRQPPPSSEASRSALTQSLRERSRVFIELARRSIYEYPASPYLPLLRQAGITHDVFARLVGDHGIEGALGRLHEAGVRTTLDEFKGRRPIRRGDLVVPTEGQAFDNPLSVTHYESRTGGSRSAGGRVAVDLGRQEHDAHYDRVFLEMFDLTGRPGALWHPAPPGAAGIGWAIRFARLGHPPERWFSQTPVSFRLDARHAALMRAIALVSRWSGRAIPQPEHVSLGDAVEVARWCAGCCSRGSPAWLSTTTSSAVRLCLAARDHRLDISGTFIRCSGEPLSAAKARIMAGAGCIARCHYATAETGRIAMACGHPSTDDDVHVVSDKMTFVQREVELEGGTRLPALFATTLRWNAPKVMLNVELGDFAVMERRACGCIWDELGFTNHLHTIRSYEKLTSEGMQFVGTDLITLLEEVLPARFGGSPTDYQFVEEERDGLTTVSLVISPTIGPLREEDVQATVLKVLGSRDAAHRMMTALWRDAGTLRVERREPHATNAGKVLAMHVMQVDRQ